MRNLLQGNTRREFIESAAATVAGAVAGTTGMRSSHAQSPPPSSSVGKWSSVYAWPDVAIHLNLLPSGKVLTFADDDHGEFETNGTRKADFTKAFVVNIPNGGEPSASYTTVNNTTTNLFCCGHSFLPDGRLLAMGGHEGKDGFGSTDTNILSNGTPILWRKQNKYPMSAGRWYPTATTLANGEVLTLSGSMDHDFNLNQLPEVWKTNQGGGWRPLTSARLPVPLYPMIYLAPNGKVFVAGPDTWTRYLNTSGTGAWTDVGSRRYGWKDYGSSAMYADGKVLMAGGGDPPTNTAEVIDLNVPSPVWRAISSMRYARRHMNATILPDGKVLVTGGTSSPGHNNASQSVLAAEMWDPATEQWTTMASMQVKRLYHSTALLLPDGRVLSAGGGRPAATNGGANEENAEIYSPPYLFNGARPTISSAPASVVYRQTFFVGTPNAASIAKVTWLKLGAVSHTINMDQRINRLSFSGATNGLNVTAPSLRNLAPPGHYMLFILNGNGVPSVARIVRLS